MAKIKFIFLILLLLQLTAQAEEISVVSVKRNIPLSEDEPVFKDFYLNAGEGSGLKKNLVVNVKRRISIKDNGEKSIGDFDTVVGQLRIIQVDKKVATAREYKLIPRDEEPMLDQIGIMTGDSVDLAGSFTDSTPAKKKERVPSSQTATAALPQATEHEKNAPQENSPPAALPMIRGIPLETPEI